MTHQRDSGPVVDEGTGDEVVETFGRWLDAVVDGDFDSFWSLTDGDFRLCEAQAWIHANAQHPGLQGEERDLLAAELARIRSGHPLRPYFEHARRATTRQQLPPIPRARWQLLRLKRQVAEGFEMLTLTDLEELPRLARGADFLGRRYLFRATGYGWKLAAIDHHLPPVPGWPPRQD